MTKKRMPKKIISLVLVFSLILPLFTLTGCEQDYDHLKKEKVQFEKSGEYTIKFNENDLLDILDDGNVQDTSAKPACDFKDITKDDVQVAFDNFTGEVVTDAQGNPTNELKVGTKNAEITNFDNSGKEITITFKDEDAFANNVNGSYAVVIPKAKSTLIVEPQLPDNTLSSTIKSVSSEATENTIIIDCKDGKFNPDITKENVVLDYSFKDMQVVSLEPNGNRLTIKLSGKPVIIPEISQVYTAGEIEIAPEGFEKATFAEEISFDVMTPVVAIDTDSIKGGNGKYTVPINVSGVDVSNIKAEDISFGENTRVTDIEKKNGQVIAEVETDSMDELDGPMQFGDQEYLSNFSHAAVFTYPIDYEKSGDNYVISFYVFPYIGKISDGIDKSQITLLDDFANGTVTELEKDEDDELGGYLLTVEVPSNGASVDDMNLVGTIVFAEGALIEEWGDKAPEFTITSIYNKDFFQITNATDEGLNNDKFDLTSLLGLVAYAQEPQQPEQQQQQQQAEQPQQQQAQNNDNGAKKPTEAEQALKNQKTKENRWKATGMAVDYVASKLTNVGGTAAEVAKYGKIVYNFGKGVATGNPADIVAGVIGVIEAMGVFDEEVDPNNPSNKSLNDKVDDMAVLLNAMDQKLDTVIKNQYKQMTQGYENALDALRTDCIRAEKMLQGAKDIYVAQGNKVPGKNASIDELKAYNSALIKIIMDEEKKGNAGFRGYTSLINRIENNYILVTTETSKTWDKNPIFYNDSAWSEYFNYDSEGYYIREAYRSNVKYQISSAYAVLSLYYEIPANADRYNDLTMRMKTSLETIDAHPADPVPRNGYNFTYGDSYIVRPDCDVYSSTFKKVVTGFEHPANGISAKKGQNGPIMVGDWSGDPTNKVTSKYKFDYPTYIKYMSKLHGKSVWDDLVLAFPYMDHVRWNNWKDIGKGIGFGGSWGKSGFRLMAQGVFNLHDWIYYEQILTWDGKFDSVKTYDTGADKYPLAIFIRPEFK